MNFVNLTNGLQAIEDYGLVDYRFLRIQSTACEQKRWNFILKSLSDDFMMNAALGNECIVYDYGARKEVPRSIWQGLEWIKFVLSDKWHHELYIPEGKKHRSGPGYFKSQILKLDSQSKSRIRYFRKYLNGPLHIYGVSKPTVHDGNFSYYKKIIIKNQLDSGR